MMNMKLSFRALLCATAMSASLAGHAGSSTYVAGQRLSPAELAKLSGTATVRLGSQSFRTLPGPATTKSLDTAANAATLVVNERGVVGESRNEVLVSQVATQDVRQKLGKLSHPAISAEYFDHMNLSKLKFATFQDAVNARDQLKTLLAPDAGVDVPIRYGKPRVR